MGSAGLSAFGTLVQMDDGAGNYTTIAELGDISGWSFGRDTHETTTHDSPASWDDFVAGVKRTGELSFPINWVPTSATHDDTTGLLSKLNGNGNPVNFKFVAPDSGSTSIIVPAIVTGFALGAPVHGRLTADVTLKGTGQPTFP